MKSKRTQTKTWPTISLILCLIILLVIGLFLPGCSKQVEPTPETNKMTIRISGCIEGITKASETGFEEGDDAGIYVVDYLDESTPGTLSPSSNRATNTKHIYQTSDNSWNTASGQPIYWKDESTKIDLYGYYPYQETNPASVTAYNFSVQTDQSTVGSEETLGGYESSDFLWGKTAAVVPQQEAILLAFGHKLSKVVISLVGGTGFEDGLPQSDIQVKITGTIPSATIDLTSGIATVNEATEAQTITTVKEGNVYKAIVVPQTLDQATAWVEVTIGTDVFTYTGTYTFVPNKQHNLTLTLNKTENKGEMQLVSNNIVPWEEDAPTQGNANQVTGEKEALIAFYRATNGHLWTNQTNWCTDEPLGTWYGVTTDEEGHVTGLRLPSNNLTGEIPPEIGNLTHLTDLYLGGNQLSGEIPPEIGNLTNLSSLSFMRNQLSGSIPDEIGNLKNLQSLDLSENTFSGSLPTRIGELVNLERLWLADCNLNNLPDEIGNLKKLHTLNLGRWINDYANGNQIGTLPPAIGQLSNLQYLYLVNCELTSLPAEIGQLTNLQQLWVYNNELTSLPDEIENLANLYELLLFNNQLSSLPSTIGNLTNLTSLRLDHNQLSGEIPVWIGNLTNLQTLYLNDNQLSGEIPAWIGNLINLTSLNLSNNRLTGEIPAAVRNHPHWNDWIPSINIIPQQDGYGVSIILGVGENSRDREALIALYNATGGPNWTNQTHWCSDQPIETWYGIITDENGVSRIMLNSNQLSGEIPAEIGNLSNLKDIYLSSNQLSGEIPPEIGNLTNLQTLYLYNNQLSGEIPSEIGNLTNLQKLYLSNNQLSGEIPAEIGNLTNLTHLELYDNQLSGTIPAEIGNLTNLTSLWLKDNQLSGEIPASLKNNPRWSSWKSYVIPQQPGYGFTNADD